jgi:ABC-2 type transport system permease protein
MRLRNLYAYTLREQRWQIVGFGLALGLMAALVVFLWPSYKDDFALIELPPAVRAFIGNDLSIATAAGFINAQFFTWTPLLLIVYAITQGTGAIAGEETNGTMDLLLAQPITRTEIVLAKTAVAVTGSAIIAMMAFAGFALSIPWVAIDLTHAGTFRACANVLPLALFFFALSLWFGAIAPSRTHAVGASIAVGVVTYFINSLAAGVNEIDGLRYASPFYYFGRGLPLVRGINWAHVAVLMSLAVAFTALSLRAFNRRDVVVGAATDMRWRDVMRRAIGAAPASSETA